MANTSENKEASGVGASVPPEVGEQRLDVGAGPSRPHIHGLIYKGSFL